MDKLRLVSELMKEGFSLIDAGLSEEAVRVGRQLKKLRHSSAFEIMALGHLQEGKVSKAIAVLEQGVREAQRVWVLWELLGNCYSDAERFHDAELAYQEALLREGCDNAVVHLNRAIAFGRAGKPAEATAAIRRVKSPHLLRRAEACRIRIELRRGNKRMARRLALRLCRRPPAVGECYDRKDRSEIFLACALALKENGQTLGKARRIAFRAVEQDPSNREALEVIRESNRRKGRPKLYQIVFKGTWDVPIGRSRMPPGFFRSCRVAASSEKAAFQHGRLFFPTSVRKSLGVEESKVIRNGRPLLEGVYFLSGYCFYPRRKRT